MMQGLSRKTRHAMRRAHRRRGTELNIVSMIDILTVLVFFLLVNSTGVAILGVNLPGTDSSDTKPPPHQLVVAIHPSTLVVNDENGTLKALPRLPDGNYDLKGLGQLLEQIKQREPHETKITLLLEPGIPYNALVEVMDTVREQPTADNSATITLFPDIALGDAGPLATHAKPAAPSPNSGGQP